MPNKDGCFGIFENISADTHAFTRINNFYTKTQVYPSLHSNALVRH